MRGGCFFITSLPLLIFFMFVGILPFQAFAVENSLLGERSLSNSTALIGGQASATFYRLGAGDVINITVYGEEDLSRVKYRLPDSGLIMFPFGEVRALDMTIAELESAIENGLRGNYLLNPRVSVSMDEYRPFFINGQVAKPGAYPYQAGLTVRMAVSIAGGLKERASERSIFVQREKDLMHTKEEINMDGLVYPGDTVTVEESFF